MENPRHVRPSTRQAQRAKVCAFARNLIEVQSVAQSPVACGNVAAAKSLQNIGRQPEAGNAAVRSVILHPIETVPRLLRVCPDQAREIDTR
jgi:hypothetical protein